MTAVSSRGHLELRVPTGESIRDTLREELGEYACGAIMLDGVSRDVHQRIIVNNPYELEKQSTDVPHGTQVEVLF